MKAEGIVLDDEAQYEDDDFEDETHAEDELADQLEAALRKQECEGFLDEEQDDEIGELPGRSGAPGELQPLQTTLQTTSGIEEEEMLEGTSGTTPLWATSNKAMQFRFTDTDLKRKTRPLRR